MKSQSGDDTASDNVACPGDECSFEGEVAAVASHVAERGDRMHTWERLDYDDGADFQNEAHLEAGQRFESAARESRDHGEFDKAVRELEGALWHFQRAKLHADDTRNIGDRCREVLRAIDRVETEEERRVVDNLLNRAESAIDTGDESFSDGDIDMAETEYERAIELLKDAATLGSEVASDRTEHIDRQLRRTRLYRQSLDQSDLHSSLRDHVAAAREHAAAGNDAFQKSEYGVALDEYEKARTEYETVVVVLDAFTFGEPVDDPTVCDVCRHQFDEELEFWEIDLGETLQVCPSCARFGTGRSVPSPQEVASEHRSIVENIESIRDGDVGLGWTSDGVTEEPESSGAVSGSRDRRAMLLQLIGVYQTLGEPPTAAKLDEDTDFGYLEYEDEFGSIQEALREAGFDI